MKVNQQKYSEEQVFAWAEYLNQDHTLTEVSTYFNVPYKSVIHLLNRYGLRTVTRHQTKIRRLNNENIPYFHEIDSHEKAYFLGLLYSDGYICSANYNATKIMGIALQLQDKYILEYFHSVLDLKTKLNVYKNSVKLSVTNKSLYEDLCNLGMVEDKSHKDYTLPPIEPEFLNSFLLGYFDGDGCVTIKNSGAIVVSICGNSKVFLECIQDFLDQNNIQTRLNEESKNKKNPLYVLYLKGRKNQIAFRDLIYKNSPIWLTRKHEKMMSIPEKYFRYGPKEMRY